MAKIPHSEKPCRRNKSRDELPAAFFIGERAGHRMSGQE